MDQEAQVPVLTAGVEPGLRDRVDVGDPLSRHEAKEQHPLDAVKGSERAIAENSRLASADPAKPVARMQSASHSGDLRYGGVDRGRAR